VGKTYETLGRKDFRQQPRKKQQFLLKGSKNDYNSFNFDFIWKIDCFRMNMTTKIIK
jgi:hypothetical protein